MRRLGTIIALAAALCATTAQAQETQEEIKAEASRLYKEGRQAMKNDQYREAALAFEGASRLKPHAVALYTAAQAWELAGEPDRAADAYAQALATPKLNEKQAQLAREHLDALSKDLGAILVEGVEGTRVQMDDHNEARTPARLHARAGDHVILIIRPDGSSERREISIAVGETIELDTAKPAGPQQRSGAKKKRKKPRREARANENPSDDQTTAIDTADVEPTPVLRTIGFITAGAGVATLAGATLFGLSANSAKDAYVAAPRRETFDHAQGLESTTNLLLVAGSVLTVAGVGLVIWQSGSSTKSQESVSLRIAPNSVWAGGRF